MDNDDEVLIASLLVAVDHCLARAMARFALPAEWRARLVIRCDLRGRAAGKVEVLRQRRQLLSARLRLNLQAARLDWRQMVDETIPHEVAHLVVMSLPHRFNQQPHGRDWQQVCRELGGQGAVRHQLPLQRVRQPRLWHYCDSHGVGHQLTSVRHHRLQRGQRYQVLATGAWLDAAGLIGPVSIEGTAGGNG